MHTVYLDGVQTHPWLGRARKRREEAKRVSECVSRVDALVAKHVRLLVQHATGWVLVGAQ